MNNYVSIRILIVVLIMGFTIPITSQEEESEEATAEAGTEGGSELDEFKSININELDPLFDFTVGLGFGPSMIPRFTYGKDGERNFMFGLQTGESDTLNYTPLIPSIQAFVNHNLKKFKHIQLRHEVLFSFMSVIGDETSRLINLGFGSNFVYHKYFENYRNYAFYGGGGTGFRFLRASSDAVEANTAFSIYFKGFGGIEYTFGDSPVALNAELYTDLVFLRGYDQGLEVGNQTIDVKGTPMLSFGIQFGVSFLFLDERVVNERNRRLEIQQIEMDDQLFFALNERYSEDLTIGTIKVENKSEHPLQNVSIELLNEEYIQSGGTLEKDTLPILTRGNTAELELHILFSDKVFEFTDAKLINCKVVVNYEDEGQKKKTVADKQIQVQPKYALVWDDDRKLGSFITVNDPAVMGFASFAKSVIRAKHEPYLDPMEYAALVFVSLAEYGIQYNPDPKSQNLRQGANVTQIDSVKFPRETLEYKLGDCEDFVVLYCALLEFLGVHTALVTVPGHIFMMFSTGVHKDDFYKVRLDESKIIVHPDPRVPDEKVPPEKKDEIIWIPIEVTKLNAFSEGAESSGDSEPNQSDNFGGFGGFDGFGMTQTVKTPTSIFLEAWDVAANQYQNQKQNAKIYIYDEVKDKYPPVSMIKDPPNLIYPSKDNVEELYREIRNDYSIVTDIVTFDTLKIALEENPLDRDSAILMAELLLDTTKKDSKDRNKKIEAIEILELINSRSAGDKDILVNLCLLYLEVGRINDATDIYKNQTSVLGQAQYEIMGKIMEAGGNPF